MGAATRGELHVAHDAYLVSDIDLLAAPGPVTPRRYYAKRVERRERRLRGARTLTRVWIGWSPKIGRDAGCRGRYHLLLVHELSPFLVLHTYAENVPSNRC